MRKEKLHPHSNNRHWLFVAAYSAMSLTGMSSALAVMNPHALPLEEFDGVEAPLQKKRVTGHVQDVNGLPIIGASVLLKVCRNARCTSFFLFITIQSGSYCFQCV